MNKTPVIAIDGKLLTEQDLRDRDAQVKEQGRHIQGYREAEEMVRAEMAQVDRDMDEGIRIENKFRAAGFLPSEARDLLAEMKPRKIGEIHQYKVPQDLQAKLYVKTPFGTVVPAQTYVDTLQKRLIEVSSVPAEIEIANFRAMGFTDHIKAGFKKLFAKLS